VSGDVSVLLGRGDGSFESVLPDVRATLAYPPDSVVTGDLTGDGKMDLIVRSRDSGEIAVIMANGDGGFGLPDYRTLGFVWSFGLADYDLDGALDLLVVDRDSSEVVVHYGDGDGTFSRSEVLGSSPSYASLVTGDLNGDGAPDWVAYGKDEITAGMNPRGGGGHSCCGLSPGAMVDGSPSLAAIDMNLDGAVDLVSIFEIHWPDDEPAVSRMAVLLNNGDLTFTSHTIMEGTSYWCLEAGEFNGDGFPDVAAGGRQVAVFLGRGDGTLELSGTLPYCGGDIQEFMSATDVNGDGFSDVVLINDDTRDVAILMGHGDGTFELGQRYVTGANRSQLLRLADLNGDGMADIVTADGNILRMAMHH
jgi:hypothetical protein